MPRLPIICQHCGSIFLSGINLGQGSGLVYLSGKIEITCPSCGQGTILPHGVYQFINETALAFTQRRLSPPELRRLADKLRGFVEQKLSPEETAAVIRSEKQPELRRLADVLPKTRIELYAFLAFLIMFFTFLVSIFGDRSTSDQPTIQADTIVNNFFESLEQSDDSK